jgi:predicted ferric reductase
MWLMFVDSESRTGLFAWTLLWIWVLMSMYRDKLGMKYEMWRYSHALGFVAMIVLATHHAVTVGRHGRYNIWFDVLWITLCAVAVGAVFYTYFYRPSQVARKPFKVKDCRKVGKDDWYVTLEKDGDFAFNFDAGQFCWLNATGSIYNREEHPFSIASSPASLPSVSFLIRDLGDFTASLDQRLEPGRRVYLDGPHGVFTLTARKARGIGLIAGGAGIGPILGILRQLRDIEDSRPIRLIYGNRTMDQMVFQDEIKALEAELQFDQTLVLSDPPPGFDGHVGVIDKELLDRTFAAQDRDAWDYYVCGPPLMVDAVSASLKEIGVPVKRILFERLGY